ncbi:hypothetical protein TNCV_2877141 [Trichonephila clavipes]|uniref:Uncharacterized protein n=1 Tax=Trichonephila clavipes TaxID=2585209 RepID=A0A8X6WDV1_TRICX|nr:hypothetical protein TNCV_2877141 [Trichonephila clavipes]
MAGWRGWFVTDLLRLRFRVRPRLKLVDFRDAENRQRPCRMNMRAQVPLGRKLRVKITCGNWYRLYVVPHKKVFLGNEQGLKR